MLDAEQGEPFSSLPSAGFLSPQQASVISLGVLEGVKALHDEGLLHGALVESNVRVLPGGQVRLTGHHLARLDAGQPAQSELALEVRRAGEIVCEAFGIPVQRNPREAPRAVEHAAPALVSTARTIASGGTGADVALAISSFRDTAGPLARPERQEIGRDELAALVKARRSGADPNKEIRYKGLAAPIAAAAPAAAAAAGAASGPTAPAPARPGPAPSQPRPTWSERHAPARPIPHEYDAPRRGRTALIAGAVVALLVIAAIAVFGFRSFLAGSSTSGNQPAAGSSSVPQTSAPPKTSASPLPAAVPSFGPASAGSIQKVDLALTSTSCNPGQICTFEVHMYFQAAPAHSVSWNFKLFDRCSYTTTDAGGGTISTQDGWNNTVGSTQIQVPQSKGQVAVVAVGANQGDSAASPAVLVGQPSNCT